MEKVIAVFYNFVFVILLIVPVLGILFGQTQPEDSEWRTHAKLPVLGPGLKLNNYPKAVDDFINDNFGFRHYLLTLFGEIKLNVFETNPVQTDLIGKEDWLFHNPILPPEYKPFYDHVEFKQEELDALKKRLVSDRDFLKTRNIDYILLIIPDKDVVYPEYYPYPGYFIFDIRLKQFLEYMKKNTDLNIIYVKDALLKEKSQTPFPLYYKGDTHWTNLGAYFGYKEVMNQLKKDHPEIYVPSLEDFDVTIGGKHEDDLMRLNPDWKKVSNKIDVNLKDEVTKRIEKLHKVYVFGDSFSININGPKPEGLNYFLKLSFDEVDSNHYSWPLKYEEIDKTKPELVIRESVQRYIYDWTTMPNTVPPSTAVSRR